MKENSCLWLKSCKAVLRTKPRTSAEISISSKGSGKLQRQRWPERQSQQASSSPDGRRFWVFLFFCFFFGCFFFFFYFKPKSSKSRWWIGFEGRLFGWSFFGLSPSISLRLDFFMSMLTSLLNRDLTFWLACVSLLLYPTVLTVFITIFEDNNQIRGTRPNPNDR